MGYFQKLLFLLPILFLVSCDVVEEPENMDYSSYTSAETYSYSDVKDKEILYSNIFGVKSNSYYVYFYSRTCSHCNDLKSFIIPKIIERSDIYLVEASEQVTIVEDISLTIGASSIENFGILGYPSLVKIDEKVVSKNIAGINPIKNELTN